VGKELYQEQETFSNQRGRQQKIRRNSENLQIVFWLHEKDKIPYRIMRASTSLLFGRIIGTILSLNFVCFWAFPIAFMGMTYKYILSPVILPVYKMIDSNSTLRWLAEEFVYSSKDSVDYFLISILVLLNSFISLSAVFYYQFSLGYLPAWLVALYYCSWVGTGGRMMGAAYALAHKEGHSKAFYKKWVRNIFGNVFENWIGLIYGSAPGQFSCSHVFIHHRLDGGPGDTFYQWDLDRSSVADFMLYVSRVFLHMIGYSSSAYFTSLGQKSRSDVIVQGMMKYTAAGVAMLVATRSLSFVFWIFVQPLICMTFFLALINFGFHGFIEYDENGQSVNCVNSSTIIEGDDDYFGEDDHMAHHYNANVGYKDLAALQASKVEEFKAKKASVFRKLSILELSIFILFGLWDKLADHYVDYTGKMTRDEIKEMLKVRAQRKEMSYEEYMGFLKNPTNENKKYLLNKNHHKRNLFLHGNEYGREETKSGRSQ